MVPVKEEVIYSGFLVKSPPEHKINRARWLRRWFVLRRTAGAVYLQYYKDESSNRPKGTINLNDCEQVDQGLTFEAKRHLAKAFVFGIVTPKRKYFLVSNKEEDMIRWVREICLACGFQLENQEEDEIAEPAVATQPISVAQSPLNAYSPRPFPASVPADHAESYIPLDECKSGQTKEFLSQSVPVNGGWDGTGNQEVFSMDSMRRSRTGSSSSNSSMPNESPPLPPQSETEVAGMENYDIPPALQRLSIANMQPTYDVPPALLRRDPSLQTQDDIYKPVPVPRPADLNSSIHSPFTQDNQNQLNGGAHDLYAVPPRHDGGGIYDYPPAHPLVKNQNKETTSSTDKLAQDFKQISVRNSRGTDDSLDIYNVPQSSLKNAADLFTSPEDAAEKSATPPPRPPKLTPTSATSIETQAVQTPPRPPKPQHLRPSTPPSSFDDTYAVPPVHAMPVSSQELDVSIYSVPPSHIRSPPNGHQWLDSKVPTPGGPGHRYINTSKSANRQSLPPKSAGYFHQRVVPPPPQPQRSFDSDLRYGPSPTLDHLESYLPMDGSSGESNVFQYPGNSTYMAMEGTNGGPRLDGRSFSESQQETYALMNSGVPLQRGSAPGFGYRHTFSGGERPPPIDRSLKPDRKTSEGGIRSTSTERFGMEGSFYATSDSLPPRPVSDMRPVQSDRTRSYSRRPGQYENARIDTDADPYRVRSNTGDSTTSSSDDDLYGPGEHELYAPRAVPTVPEEDTYIYKDVPGTSGLSERPLTEGLSNTPFPAPPPCQQSDEIEYLELSHDHEEEARQPPPRPPKSSSPTVEYFDLDPDKTQALRFVTERREEEKDGGMSGRSTLTRNRDV
ncbi:GRB2-associated-binding protein 1-like isoform X2 [Patiria miniata]|uniref:PH domain-containing protein n=1 Tax=Patiria miniata TaxID=46514 RepID=A0A913ZZN8_PATMI|nr:GRB2-associated-binding protein 1-like isoform X2 [Patiria miniata]